MHFDTSDQEKPSEIKRNTFAIKCYSRELFFGYSCSEAPAASSVYPLPIPDKDGKQTPDVQDLNTHSILSLKQIHHQLMHFTSVFRTEHGTIL